MGITSGGWTISGNPITIGSGGLGYFSSSTTTISSNISGAGSITLSSGGLDLNGSVANSITVSSGAVLGGTGTFSGAVALAGGQLAGGTYAAPVIATDGTITGGTFNSTLTVGSGTLTVTGSAGGNGLFSVSSGATLNGTGTIQPAVMLSGGTLAGTLTTGPVTSVGGQISPGSPGVPGTLAIGGSLSLDQNSTLNYKLGTPGQAGASDQITVTGNVSLDGTLNVRSLTGFGVGTYTLVNCSGQLTENLTIGTTPAAGQITVPAGDPYQSRHNYSYTYSLAPSASNQQLQPDGCAQGRRSGHGCAGRRGHRRDLPQLDGTSAGLHQLV